MTLQRAIAEYVAVRQSRGEPFTTQQERLQRFCRAVGPNRDVTAVTGEQVRAVLGQPITSYWRAKYATLNGFYRYAISRGYVRASPLPPTVPKMPPPLVPYIYTAAEIRRLLDATTSYRKYRVLLEPHTFRAVLLLLYGAGLRISEALALQMADVDLAERVLLIRQTKFAKTRYVPIGRCLTQAMGDYVATRRAAGHAEDPERPFFVGRSGARLSVHYLQESFRRLRAHAGVRRSAGARDQPRLHDCRHTFTVRRLLTWYESGADVARLLPLLSTYLGHRDLNSTQRYLTMTPALLHQASRRFEQYVKGGIHE